MSKQAFSYPTQGDMRKLAEAKRASEFNQLNLGKHAFEGSFPLHAGRTDEALIQLQKMKVLESKF